MEPTLTKAGYDLQILQQKRCQKTKEEMERVIYEATAG
jgi:hypothetical protein